MVNHTHAIVIALVEFHKAQCYFSFSLQIAALVLIAQNSSTKDMPDYQDARLMPGISMTGIVPVIFTLTCISRYGRQSWYLIILSSVTGILATATLISITRFWAVLDAPVPDTGIADFDSATRKAVCGTMNWSDICNPYSATAIDRVPLRYTWAVWAICCLWLIYCVLSKLLFGAPKNPRVARLVENWKTPDNRLRASIHFVPLSCYRSLGLLSWMFCFAFQLYYYAAYFLDGLVSTQWTFGQIISVTVWMPSIVEYLYLEFCKFQVCQLSSFTLLKIIKTVFQRLPSIDMHIHYV